MRKVYVEGYGCSMNKAETEQLLAYLVNNGFEISKPGEADYLIINTCAVKERTDFNMLQRIKEFQSLAKDRDVKILVCGCLPKINEKMIPEANNIFKFGVKLEEICEFLKLEKQEYSPKLENFRENKNITIIPVSKGCLSNCAFCGTKKARGNLESYSIESILEKVRTSLKETKEIWLTSQDMGCYGFDIKTNLPNLLKEILNIKGDYRIRIGMMNPLWLKKIYGELIPLFKDDRLYKFLHVPIQSGSNKILKLMRRGNTAEEYLELMKKLKRDIPEITISTDIIVGFPEETEEDFQETVKVLNEVKPSVVNISKYGIRPDTTAATMKQVLGKTKKRRSRILTDLCKNFSRENNRKLVGRQETIFVNEEGKNDTFVGRTQNYKPVVINKDLQGEFIKVKLKEAHQTYLIGEVLE